MRISTVHYKPNNNYVHLEELMCVPPSTMEGLRIKTPQVNVGHMPLLNLRMQDN